MENKNRLYEQPMLEVIDLGNTYVSTLQTSVNGVPGIEDWDELSNQTGV